MKNVITQTFLAVLFLATYSCSIYSQDLPWIKVDGNQFANENGEIILFKALNTSDPDKLDKDGHWDQEYDCQDVFLKLLWFHSDDDQKPDVPLAHKAN